jgi:hypothetical protein
MTTSRDVIASSPDTCPGQISWDYDRAEIRPMGVVQHRNRADSGLRDRPGDDARALGCLQHVARLARQVGSAPLRPLRGPSIDRRSLHAVPGADENVLASAGFGSRALAYLQLVSRTCR